MQNQLQEASSLFEKLNGQPTIDACWNVFLNEVKGLGFCNALYGFVTSKAEADHGPEITYFSNYPDDWHEEYERLGGQKNDYSVAHCINFKNDLRWYMPAQMEQLTTEQKAIELAAQKFGAPNGITFPLRAGAGGKDWGGVGLATQLDNKAFDALLAECQDYLRLISQIFHSVVLSRPLSKNILLLTDKEKEALSLAARGLKTKQIADRLGITDKSVEQRIDRATSKLDSSNRTQAVAEAIRLHILRV